MSPLDRRAVAGLNRTIPALPVRDVSAAVAYYLDRFGFDARHATGDFAIVGRDDAVLHLRGATDDDWRSREDLDRQPICSGAESFLAGTASCRIEVSDVDALFAELQSAGVLHDVSRAGVTASDFGRSAAAAPRAVPPWLPGCAMDEQSRSEASALLQWATRLLPVRSPNRPDERR